MPRPGATTRCPPPPTPVILARAPTQLAGRPLVPPHFVMFRPLPHHLAGFKLRDIPHAYPRRTPVSYHHALLDGSYPAYTWRATGRFNVPQAIPHDSPGDCAVTTDAPAGADLTPPPSRTAGGASTGDG